MPLKFIPYNASLPLNTHRPPIQIKISEPATLKFDLESWGSIPGYGNDEAEIEVPEIYDHRAFAEMIGKVLLDINWRSKPLKQLYVRCTTQESFDVINNYFMGIWHL